MQELFSEFKKTSAADWKNRLMKDLKGEAFENLVWKNENGFEVQPFYTSEDLKTVYEPAFTHSDWQIGVQGKSSDPVQVNAQLLRNLAAGATSISLYCDNLDLPLALKGIQLNYICSVFFVSDKGLSPLKKYLEQHYHPAELNCCLLPLELKSVEQLDTWTKLTEEFRKYNSLKIFAADLLWAHNQDTLAYYETAMILSVLNEQAANLSQHKIKSEAPLIVRTGVTTDYFIQIAKLRAIRRLWKILKKEYGLQNELYFLIESSQTDKSVSDSYNNLLRTTLEAMAAVSGGCNELILSRFDVLFETNTSLSERMAINQQLILKEESYMDKMADTACGSYYIESITDALAQKTLEEFKRFEKEGGYFECLRKGIFDKDIKLQSAVGREAVSSKQRTIIGVNKFRNEKEQFPLSEQAISALKNTRANNPILNFELDNFLKSHA